MPNQFNSPEGDLENYFVTESWLIDQWVGDELWTWGYGNNGRLGNAVVTGSISTPVTTFAGGTNWKQVACGFNHTATIKTDGTLWTWGYGSSGQRGESAISYTEKTVSGSIARFDSFIITSDTNGVNIGDTLLTRYNGGLVVNVVTNTYIEMQASAPGNISGDFVFALLPPASISTPVTTFAGGTNWKQVVSGGSYHTAAIKTDGTLWTWGLGSSGQIGDNTSLINRLTPVTTFAGGTNWKQVTGGLSHTSAIKTDGTLWIWGAGGNGRLGNAVTIGNISTPVTTFAGGTNWKQVSGGSAHTAAVFSGTTPDLPIS